MFGWPSGLRRWFKAPVSSGAWVRIPLRTPFFSYSESAIGLVVKYLVANEVPRVRFPDGACSCGAVGSASVLCADGPGFEPLQEHFLYQYDFNSIVNRTREQLNIVRSYHGETTGSHPNSEVKHHWACSVLRWGTTRESQVVYVLP